MTGQLRLLTGYQTPAPLRRIGAARLETWLRNRKVRNPAKLAQIALAAAHQQRIQLPGEALTAQLVAALAGEVITLNEQIRDTDNLIEDRFHQHEHATVITSMPGIGTLLGAEFLAATGGDMTFFGTPDRLASFAGLAPAPFDSGRIRGNLHRPVRYHRGLQRVFYYSAMIAIAHCPDSKRFYARNAPKANDTTKPCPHWPAAASTSCGHSSATNAATSPPRPWPPDIPITHHSDGLTGSLGGLQRCRVRRPGRHGGGVP